MTEATTVDVEATAASWAASLDYDAIPEPVRESAKRVLLDTVGIAIHGSDRPYIEDSAEILADFGLGATDSGGATTFVTRDRRSPLVAANLNSTGASSTEYYEGTQGAGMAGIHVVPAALAVAEHVDATGTELVEAIVAGYEVSTRVSDLARPLRSGLHGHGGPQPVGPAVATGLLVDLDQRALADSIRMAVNPFVVGHWDAILDGETVRNYYSGITVEHGMRAALLAAAGVTGVDSAIERCLLPALADEEPPASAVRESFGSLGAYYWLAHNMFKMYPSCRYTHAPLEALEAIADRRPIDPDDVEGITVHTMEFGTYGDIQHPTCAVDAKYSTPYVLASRIVRGELTVENFEQSTIEDDAIHDLSGRIEVVADPDYERRATERDMWGGAVSVTFRDGETVREDVHDPSGGADDPPTVEELSRKFESLVAGADVDADPERLRARLLGVEEVGNVAALFGGMSADE